MKHTPEQKAKAYKYYCKGLNSKEIAKLLDMNFRTVQQWMNSEQWKAKATPKGLTAQIQKCRKNRLTHSEIAKALHISISTVYRHLKTSSNDKTRK